MAEGVSAHGNRMLHCTMFGVIAGFLSATLGACAGGGARQCVDHSECASGLCLSDGTCAPDGADAGPDGVDADPNAPDADISVGCSPERRRAHPQQLRFLPL